MNDNILKSLEEDPVVNLIKKDNDWTFEKIIEDLLRWIREC